MKIRIVLVFVFGYLAVAFCFAGEREEQARAVAIQWLQLVDNEQYRQSWENAASHFKKAVTKEQWMQAVAAARQPLGDLLDRKEKSSVSTNTLPGAPDGDYVVIQFFTSFSNKQEAIETITPMLDSDGQWRVSGYYVR